ncbi:MAG: hypothetical protein H7301_14335 [Cryobacterium sp.]|nr:hypothetical protein [Oligoflexia bacterium]
MSWIFGGNRIAFGTFVLVGVWLLIDALGAEKRLTKVLRPSVMHVGSLPLYAIEDPSSHVFVTQGLLASEPTLWITRGALSLLPPEEIFTLVHGLSRASKNKGLRFETALTAWLIRLTARIPHAFSEILFFRQMRSKTLRFGDSLRGILWTSLIVLVDCFYFSENPPATEIPEEILRKLEAEARRCVPKLPVALSSHSAVCPWPDAFLTLGRACLLRSGAVNLET